MGSLRLNSMSFNTQLKVVKQEFKIEFGSTDSKPTVLALHHAAFHSASSIKLGYFLFQAI